MLCRKCTEAAAGVYEGTVKDTEINIQLFFGLKSGRIDINTAKAYAPMKRLCGMFERGSAR